MTDLNSKRLILVDGTAYVYRAFFALPPLTTPEGIPTGAVYGVVNMLKRLFKQWPAAHVMVVFDPAGPTTRHEIFPEYKANRQQAPDDLHAQIQPTIDLVRAYGWPVLVMPGVEADDVIGTLAYQALNQGYEVIISSGDKDFAQLVGPHLTLVNTMTQTRLDVEGVVHKFGVRPDQIVDYLALVGDSADNIPGVEKVGPKTAVKWLTQWGTLAAMIEQADTFKGKVGDYFRASLPQLPLYQQLVTINTHIELPVEIDACVVMPPDVEILSAQLSRLGFKTWLTELKRSIERPEASDAFESKAEWTVLYIDHLDAWQQWLNQVSDQVNHALYFEFQEATTSDQVLIGCGWVCSDGSRAYLDLKDRAFQLKVLHDLGSDQSSRQKAWVVYQFKPVLRYFIQQGISFAQPVNDVELMSYALNGAAIQHDLVSLCHRYLPDFKPTLDSSLSESVIQVMLAADQLSKLYPVILMALKDQPAVYELFDQMDQPLQSILARMEATGVLLDVDHLQSMSQSFQLELDEIEEKAQTLAGQSFNLASPKQLRSILYDTLQLPIRSKTPSGEPSTSESVLTEFADQGHLLPQLILKHRQLSKLKHTYTDPLVLQVDAEQRVHGVFNQALTSTGRLSSQQPNLQNIPIRTQAGLNIRKAFIAPQGYQLLSADYSQIELRIMAHLSQDEHLCHAFEHDQDVHAATAAQLFKCHLNSVASEQRRQAKVVNFGLIYGMSAFGLAAQLNIDRSDAAQMIESYFKTFKGVQAFMEATRELAKSQQYVETLLGRRIYLPKPQHARQANAVMRAAINAPMQGSAADLIKAAMILIQQELDDSGLDARMILQVHDELIFEVHHRVLKEVEALVVRGMEQAMSLSVPLRVNVEVGSSWAHAH